MDPRPPLLVLRLRGRVADPATAETAALVTAGHATTRNEHLVLAPAGRAEAERIFRLDGDAATATQDAYDQFLTRNAELIQVCHDWQVRAGGTVNDHRDATYDWAVIDRLGTIDDRTGPVVRRLERRVDVFTGYRARLRDARRRVEDGDHEWFTSPRLDSYHTVWMELHEHLLVSLGIARGEETGPEAVAAP